MENAGDPKNEPKRFASSPVGTGITALLYIGLAALCAAILLDETLVAIIGILSGSVLGMFHSTLKHGEFTVHAAMLEQIDHAQWAYIAYRLACATAVGVVATFLSQELMELDSPRGHFIPAAIGFAAAFALDPLRLIGK